VLAIYSNAKTNLKTCIKIKVTSPLSSNFLNFHIVRVVTYFFIDEISPLHVKLIFYNNVLLRRYYHVFYLCFRWS